MSIPPPISDTLNGSPFANNKTATRSGKTGTTQQGAGQPTGAQCDKVERSTGRPRSKKPLGLLDGLVGLGRILDPRSVPPATKVKDAAAVLEQCADALIACTGATRQAQRAEPGDEQRKTTAFAENQLATAAMKLRRVVKLLDGGKAVGEQAGADSEAREQLRKSVAKWQGALQRWRESIHDAGDKVLSSPGYESIENVPRDVVPAHPGIQEAASDQRLLEPRCRGNGEEGRSSTPSYPGIGLLYPSSGQFLADAREIQQMADELLGIEVPDLVLVD